MKFLTVKEALQALDAHPGDPLAVLRALGGYYECPRGADGARTGPLVGYAGTYDGPDGAQLHFVGDVYADFAFAERYPQIMLRWANDLARRVPLCDVVCAAPLGGMTFGPFLALALGVPYIFPERVVTVAKSAMAREEVDLAFGRHAPDKGHRVLLVEDVANNFSTTAKLAALVVAHGAVPVGLGCLLNRSLLVDTEYELPFPLPNGGSSFPVGALVRHPIPQYRQDDPMVADDVTAGKVVQKPKTEWAQLEAAMAATATA